MYNKFIISISCQQVQLQDVEGANYIKNFKLKKNTNEVVFIWLV